MEYHTILITKDPDNEDLKHEKRIFESKIEALKAMKIWKTCHPRLKTFNNLEDAEENVAKILSENPNKAESSSEGCPYKGLTPQQLKQIKEAILKDNEEIIKDLVAQNPRYLMTPCDQPAIIHSGTRANALHIAANAGKVKMIELILDLITDQALVERMYPNESAESIAKRQEYLLDLYLNMPKKGDFDTPLHQASKWGHWQVIQILVEYSSCDTKRPNRDGLTPAQVVCSRCSLDADVKCKILDLLADRVYIPVCRALDNASPGFIGEPVSPADLSKTEFKTSSPKLLRSPMSKAVLNSPIVIRDDAQASSPILSPITDRAYLGPLSPKDADLIKQEWKKNSLKKRVNLTDPDKGLEQQGRILAKKYQATLEEYWFFLGAYADLTSSKGLIMLENHLQDQQRKVQNAPDTLDDLEAEMAKLNIKSDTTESSDKGHQDLNANSQLGVLNLLTNDNKVNDFQFKTSTVQDLDNSYLWNQPRQVNLNNDLSSSLIRSGSESSLDSFTSAVSDLSDQSVWSAEEGRWVYLEGDQPCQTDHQVYQVLQDCQIDPMKYPSLHTWKCLVESYLPNERKVWTRSKGVPKRSFVIPTFSYD